MRTATYNADVASDRRRRENVPRHILYSMCDWKCKFRDKAFPSRMTPVQMGKEDAFRWDKVSEEREIK